MATKWRQNGQKNVDKMAIKFRKKMATKWRQKKSKMAKIIAIKMVKKWR